MTLVSVGVAPHRGFAYSLKELAPGHYVRWSDTPSVRLFVDEVPEGGPFERGDLVEALELARHAWRGHAAAPVLTLAGEVPREGDVHVGAARERDYPELRGRLAITELSYDTASGRIVDARVWFNLDRPLASTGGPTTFDLVSVACHELGHVLGLDESDDADAVMWPSTRRGDVSGRLLHEDDVAGLVALYGPRPASTTWSCDATGADGPLRGLALAAMVLLARRWWW